MSARTLGIGVAFAQNAREEIAERAAEAEEIAREAECREKDSGQSFEGHGQENPSDEREGGSGEHAQAEDPAVETSRAASRGFLHGETVRPDRQGSP